MANIITDLRNRIAEYHRTNKKPCKSYATEANAEAAVQEMAQAAANYFTGPLGKDELGNAEMADYVVFFVPFLGKEGRWVGCINLSALLRRAHSTGGYLGFCEGFYTW